MPALSTTLEVGCHQTCPVAQFCDRLTPPSAEHTLRRVDALRALKRVKSARSIANLLTEARLTFEGSPAYMDALLGSLELVPELLEREQLALARSYDQQAAYEQFKSAVSTVQCYGPVLAEQDTRPGVRTYAVHCTNRDASRSRDDYVEKYGVGEPPLESSSPQFYLEHLILAEMTILGRPAHLRNQSA